LRLRDWPGLLGPIVHVPDPFATSPLVEALAAILAPRYRVVSLWPRPSVAYQVAAADVLGFLDQFGFDSPTLIGEGLGRVAALVVAAWHSTRVGRLVLVEQSDDPPPDTLEARALHDCPPDWPRLRAAVRCPILETTDLRDVEAFIAAGLP
jgi:pimeloyl-ACP methyl ester carboxylesterase